MPKFARVMKIFQLREEHDVLLYAQMLKKHVVLGAHTHGAADQVHLLVDVVAVDARTTLGEIVRGQQADKHVDGSSLAGAIVSQLENWNILSINRKGNRNNEE